MQWQKLVSVRVWNSTVPSLIQQAILRTCNVQTDSEAFKKIPESAKGIEPQERRWKGHKIFVLRIGSQVKDREQGTQKGQGGTGRPSPEGGFQYKVMEKLQDSAGSSWGRKGNSQHRSPG